MEEWRPIAGFPLYEVSSYGNVRSVNRVDALGRRRGRLLKLHLRGPSQYLGVNIYDALGNASGRLVHTLVLEAFIGARPTGHECAHQDGNKFNNRSENLAWKTHQENIDDKTAHGTVLKGEANPAARINAAAVIAIRQELANGLTKAHIARLRNISRTTVYNIISRRNWRHV